MIERHEETQEIDHNAYILSQLQSQQNPRDCIANLYKWYKEDPNAIKFIISHAPSSEYLSHIFKILCSKNAANYYEYASLCLIQETFTKDPAAYLKYTGKTFYNTVRNLIVPGGNFCCCH